MCQTLYAEFELFFQCNALNQNHNKNSCEKPLTCFGDEIILCIKKRVYVISTEFE